MSQRKPRRPTKRKAGGKTKFEKSAGGVVVRFGEAEPRFLLIRDGYGHWGFPKGHLERGERADTAALREVMEETGLRRVNVVAPIAAIEWRFRFRGRLIQKHCEFFLMESESGDTRPQKAEGITDCRWATIDEAQALLDYENARGVLTRASAMVAERARRLPSLSSMPPAITR
jgi:8-oxo-dGTP pyrophosphatase MutT (NUDIX family)